MHVAVCIVGFRSPDEIGACLDALDQQTWSNFSVVICENGGERAFDELSARFGQRKVGAKPLCLMAAPDNPGYAAGVNRAISASGTAEAWWVLNPDTEPAPTCLAALVARMERDGVGIVGGSIVGADGRLQSCGGRWRSALARVESIGHGWPADTPVDAAAIEPYLDYQCGASMLVTRSVVDRVGLMREDYFLYCEEVEWCVRAKDAGFALGLAPDAIILHHQGSTTGSGGAVRRRSRLPIYLDERNKINIVRDLRPWQLWTAIPAALALAVLRYGKALAPRQMGYALSGWLAGVRNLRGKPAWFAPND
jgi:N-acetylglucosaminyl-diphospho-decaprenol L-rhamnosyltransferase